MTNEIKEILDNIEIGTGKAYQLIGEISLVDINKIRDYINNLQEELERLKDYLKIMEKGKDNNLYRFLDYKQRIDKAVEYIEKNQIQNEYTDRGGFRVKENKYWLEDSDILLDILRGDE